MTGTPAKNISIFRRHTSMRLTNAEWDAINMICRRESIPRKTLFELIDMNRDEQMSLTGAIRLFTIIYYKNLYTGIHSAENTNDFNNPVFEAIKDLT